jgi:hypothetical protein
MKTTTPEILNWTVRHPSGFSLGVAHFREDIGWKFYPNVFGRSPSRQGHPTRDACLPPWVKKHLKKGATIEPGQDHRYKTHAPA